MERNAKIIVVIVIVAVLLAGTAFYYYNIYLPTLPKQLERVRVATVYDPKLMWEFQYANYSGIFEEEGLTVEIMIIRSTQEAIQAMLAGEVDFTITVGSAIRAIIKGAPLKVVSVNSLPLYWLVARPGIESLQDVKKVATLSRGATPDVLTKVALVRRGLKPDIDVAFFYVGLPGLLPALMNGEVDAAAFTPIEMFQIRNQPGYKVLITYGKEFPNYPNGGIATTDTMIKEKPKVVEAMIRAIYKSQVYLMKHREEAIKFAVDVLGDDREYAVFMYEYMIEATFIIPNIDMEGIDFLINTDAEYAGTEKVSPESVVDTSFIEKVKKELAGM